MMPEKLSPIERALVASASMPAHTARQVLMLICSAGMTTDKPVTQFQQSDEGAAHFEKRRKFIDRMKSATDRCLNYAKHETLRKVEKHFRENPSFIASADEPKNLSGSLTFDRQLFADELIAALKDEQVAALQRAGQGLFDEVGEADPFKLTDKQVFKFIKQRENLLANVPDEVHATIMQTIHDGLEQGEGRRELMQRISTAFDEIGRGRAETIANTETAAAFNYAREKAMKKAGVTHKKWLHSMSPLIKEPRPTHLEADGQIVPIDEPFDIGGVPMLRPGDESAGPEEIINCHCVAIPVEAT